MGKLILLLLLPLSSYSLSIENTLQNDPLLIKEVIASGSNQTPRSVPFEEPSVAKFFADPDNLIGEGFAIPDFFKSATRFWFDIYTQHPSNHSVLHDKDNLAIIYDVLDFSMVDASDLNQFTKSALQVKYVEKIVAKYKLAFVNLANAKSSGAIEKKIIAALETAKISLPNSKGRKKFFTNLSNNLRAQTGQKDNIQAGINAFARYEKTIREYFTAFDVPWELHAIPFLESSFNVRARSKVGASGVWQFMRWIGAHFMVVDRRQDGRDNPLISTSSALHLLKQNLKILGRLDLAIAAYNSGTKHLLKGKRLVESKKGVASLDNIFLHYEHDHIGFASKNFYAEFLALTRALAYREKIYDVPKPDEQIIKAYVSLCRIQPKWFFDSMIKYDSKIKDENRHFKRAYLKHDFPRGTILYSQADLTSRRYFEIKPEKMTSRYAKNWVLLAKGHSCSTK